MRKRIVIGLVIAVGIGTTAFFISQPKKGSIEWHKERCRQIRAEFYGETFRRRVADWSYKLTGVELMKVTDDEWEKQRAQLNESSKRLEELGFLMRREYVFTNRVGSPETALYPAIVKWLNAIPADRQVFSWLESGGDCRSGRYITFLQIIAPREDQPEWEGLVRTLDVRESGN